MSQRAKYLFKNMGILTISNFASKILVFLLVPLYTSVLSTEEYGKYELVISTVTLLYPILTANMVDGVMRFTMDEKWQSEDAASIGMRYVVLSIALFGAGLLASWYFGIFPSLGGLRAYVFIYYACYVLNQYFIQLAKGMERIRDMGIAGVMTTCVMVVANIVFLFILKMGLNGFFIANTLGQAISVFYFVTVLWHWRFPRRIAMGGELEKQMLIYSVPLIFTALGWWANSTADKYIVAFICGIAANGLLSVAYKIPSIISTVQSIFIQAWQISAIKEYDRDDAPTFYGRAFSYVNMAISLICSALIFLSKPLARILYANDFYEAWRYVPFLLVSSVINCASGFIGPILSAKKDSKSMAASAICGTIMNVGLNIILVHFMGIQGATIATAMSSFAIYVIRREATRKEMHICGYWRVLVTWALLCVQAMMEIYTRVWYAEVAIVCILLLVNIGVIRDILLFVNDMAKNMYRRRDQ